MLLVNQPQEHRHQAEGTSMVGGMIPRSGTETKKILIREAMTHQEQVVFQENSNGRATPKLHFVHTVHPIHQDQVLLVKLVDWLAWVRLRTFQVRVQLC